MFLKYTTWRLGRCRHRCEDGIKLDVEVSRCGMAWIDGGQG